MCTGQPEHFECVGIFDAERDAGIGDKDPRLGVWVGPFVRDEDVLMLLGIRDQQVVGDGARKRSDRCRCEVA